MMFGLSFDSKIIIVYFKFCALKIAKLVQTKTPQDVAIVISLLQIEYFLLAQFKSILGNNLIFYYSHHL